MCRRLTRQSSYMCHKTSFFVLAVHWQHLTFMVGVSEQKKHKYWTKSRVRNEVLEGSIPIFQDTQIPVQNNIQEANVSLCAKNSLTIEPLMRYKHYIVFNIMLVMDRQTPCHSTCWTMHNMNRICMISFMVKLEPSSQWSMLQRRTVPHYMGGRWVSSIWALSLHSSVILLSLPLNLSRHTLQTKTTAYQLLCSMQH